jgi:DNA-binding MarR family transcriptional regulator
MSVFKNPGFMARRTDPPTSHAAARHMIESGKLTEQQKKTLDLVNKYPNHTSDELATKGSLDRYQLGRRLPELEREGLITRGNERRSTVGGRMGATWHPV